MTREEFLKAGEKMEQERKEKLKQQLFNLTKWDY